MTTADIVRTAAANLGRRKLRSVLASLGVVVGTLTIVLLISLATGVRRQINRQFETLGLDRLSVRPSNVINRGAGAPGIGARGGFGARIGAAGLNAPRAKIISPADVARWKNLPGVIKVTPEVDLPGAVGLELKRNDQTQAVRMGANQNAMLGALAAPPAPVAGELELPDQGGLIASQGTLQALGISNGGEAGLIGQSFDLVLRTSRGETQAYP